MSKILTTARLKLELITSITDEVLESLYKMNSDPEVRMFFPDGTQTKEQTKNRLEELLTAYKKHGTPVFIIYSRDTGEFFGRCGFTPYEENIEVGYLIIKEQWHKGLATELLEKILAWGQENLDKKIIGFAPTNHIASQRVMEKCGMHLYKEDIVHDVRCKFYEV